MWYKEANNCTPVSSQITINRIMAERVALHQRVPPTGENILVEVEPSRSITPFRIRRRSSASRISQEVADRGQEGGGRGGYRDIDRYGDDN